MWEIVRSIGGNFPRPVRWRRLAVVALLVAAACSRGTSEHEEARPLTATGSPISVALTSAGTAWLLSYTDDGFQLGRYDDTTKKFVSVPLPMWSNADVMALDDGSVAVAGIRCTSHCRDTVSEIVFVDDDGEATKPKRLAQRVGGGINDSDGISLLGQDDTSLYVSDFVEMERVDFNGEILETLPSGPSCVLDGALYSLKNPADEVTDVPHGTVPPPRVINIAPVGSEDRPFYIRRYRGGGFQPVPDGDVEISGYFQTQCSDEELVAFSVESRTAHRWTPRTGWTSIRYSPKPDGARSDPRFESSGENYVIDAEGRLLLRRKGAWTPTTAVFATQKPSEHIPVSLRAARSGSKVFACVTNNDVGGLECHRGTLR